MVKERGCHRNYRLYLPSSSVTRLSVLRVQLCRDFEPLSVPRATFCRMKVLTAPQLTPLLDHFVSQLRESPLPPRDREIVVVQSQGMRRWLSLQLADAFGCSASMVMPFPAHFMRDVGLRSTQAHFERYGTNPFSRDVLAWRLDAKLHTMQQQWLVEPAQANAFEPHAAREAFAPIRQYLHKADARTRFGLATQIAGRFDDYQLYRADVLDAWERGTTAPSVPETLHSQWQALLWRDLRAEIHQNSPDLAAQLRQTITAVTSGDVTSLPTRITVFGVSTLPPLFVELLAALARHIPVAVYTASLTAPTVHPLAAHYHAQSRAFLEILRNEGASIEAVPALVRVQPVAATRTPTTRISLLSQLQEEMATGSDGTSPLACDANDASLRIHDAHGDVRQLEVVRDQLLNALAADPTLRPHDLLLLVPDATRWAPIVDAVFGVTAANDTTHDAHIPYRIADRPQRRSDPAADAFARLLALEGGRFARTDVLAVLAAPLVRQAVALSDTDVQQLDALTVRVNVRWGYDAEARVGLGLPRYESASWRLGMDRLLMGLLVGSVDEDVLGVFAEAGDTIGDPDIVARCASWVDSLAAMLESWATPRTLTEWHTEFVRVVNTYLHPEQSGESQQITELLHTLQDMPLLADVASYAQPVPFAVIRDWIESRLEGDGFGSGFLQGGMTVAALKPMRSLPFRVIAVVGLDDGVFPRRERRSAFDLLEHEQRLGDRDVRSDDRQLFLDLLLAAQDRLILAYTGRAVRDGSVRAPSVVIDELLDHCDRRSQGKARQAMVVQHPLQPFSLSYFAADRDARLFSYSTAHANSAASRWAQGESGGNVRPGMPFVSRRASAVNADSTSDGTLEVRLHELAQCWSNPSKYFCNHTLGLGIADAHDTVTDDELFDLTAMQAGGVKVKLLAAALHDHVPLFDAPNVQPQASVPERGNLHRNHHHATASRQLEANGMLPFGALGKAWSDVMDRDINQVVALLPEEQTPPMSLHVGGRGSAWQLHGRIDGIRGGVRYIVRAGSFRPEHYIRAWVEHVAMCAAGEQGNTVLPTRTVLVGKKSKEKFDEIRAFEPVGNAVDLLEALVSVEPEARRAPLPFFAQAGWAWCEQQLPKPKGSRKQTKDPFEEAVKSYHHASSDFSMGGDGEDAYVALCFRDRDPMAEERDAFQSLAHTLWAGLIHTGGAQ